MKGLIWKDLRITIINQRLLLLLPNFIIYLLILLYADPMFSLFCILLGLIPGGCANYAVTLRMQDEKSEFDTLAISLPVTKKEIIQSRFYSNAWIMVVHLAEIGIITGIHALLHTDFTLDTYIIVICWSLLLCWLFHILGIVSTFFLGINRSAILVMMSAIIIFLLLIALYLFGPELLLALIDSPYIILGIALLFLLLMTWILYRITYHFYASAHQ